MAREKDIISGITIEDLQEQHRPIAESIGMESFIKLVREFGGSAIYIPQMREVTKMRVYRMIRDEFDGTNIKKLASKYDVSESTVYNVCLLYTSGRGCTGIGSGRGREKSCSWRAA